MLSVSSTCSGHGCWLFVWLSTTDTSALLVLSDGCVEVLGVLLVLTQRRPRTLSELQTAGAVV
jgi:hypothetical protein